MNLIATWRPVPRSSASTTNPKVPELRSLTWGGGVGGGGGYGWCWGAARGGAAATAGGGGGGPRRRRHRGGTAAAPPARNHHRGARARATWGPTHQRHQRLRSPSRTSRAPRAGPRSVVAGPTSRRGGAEARRSRLAGWRATYRVERSRAGSARALIAVWSASVSGAFWRVRRSPPPRSEEGGVRAAMAPPRSPVAPLQGIGRAPRPAGVRAEGCQEATPLYGFGADRAKTISARALPAPCGAADIVTRAVAHREAA
jgi:hypothetical protein